MLTRYALRAIYRVRKYKLRPVPHCAAVCAIFMRRMGGPDNVAKAQYIIHSLGLLYHQRGRDLVFEILLFRTARLCT